MTAISELRKQLAQRLYALEEDQIREMLDKNKYRERIEILPNIVDLHGYYRYDNREGQYVQIEAEYFLML